VGASVEVSYLESDPESARIIPEFDWIPLVPGAAGVLAVLAGLAAFVPWRGASSRRSR
jgi:hypothetical protein